MKRHLVVLAIVCIILSGCQQQNDREFVDNTSSKGMELNTPDDFYELGTRYNNKVIESNNQVIIAEVNGIKVTLNDWFMDSLLYADDISAERLFKNIVKEKIQVAAAESLELVPSEEDIAQIMDIEKRLIYDSEDTTYKEWFAGWGITPEQYLDIIRPSLIEKLAISNWQIYVNNNIVPSLNVDYKHADIIKLFPSEAVKILGGIEVIIEPEGKKLGLKNNWVYDDM